MATIARLLMVSLLTVSLSLGIASADDKASPLINSAVDDVRLDDNSEDGPVASLTEQIALRSKAERRKLSNYLASVSSHDNADRIELARHIRLNDKTAIRRELLDLNPDEREFVSELLLACPKIVGGSCSKIADFPWMVALKINVGSAIVTCAGSRISKSYVLTAAHCIDRADGRKLDTVSKVEPGDVSAYLGSSQFGKGFRADIAAIFVHPEWKNTGIAFDYDAAVLKLVASTSASATVKIRSLPIDDAIGPAWVAGWGRTGNSSDQQSSLVIRSAKIGLLSNDRCAQAWATAGVVVSAQMMCAGNNIVGTCSGDSGGPLIAGARGNEQIIGITSWVPAQFCGDDPNFATHGKGFTRTSILTAWLRKDPEIALALTDADPGPLFSISQGNVI